MVETQLWGSKESGSITLLSMTPQRFPIGFLRQRPLATFGKIFGSLQQFSQQFSQRAVCSHGFQAPQRSYIAASTASSLSQLCLRRGHFAAPGLCPAVRDISYCGDSGLMPAKLISWVWISGSIWKPRSSMVHFFQMEDFFAGWVQLLAGFLRMPHPRMDCTSSHLRITYIIQTWRGGEGLSPWPRPVELGQLGWASVVVPSKLFACHWGKGNVWPAVQWRFKTYRLVRWHLGRKRIAFHWRLRHVKTLWIFKTPKLRRVRNRARSHSPSVSADTCETRQDINFTFRVSDGFSMCQSSDLINGVFICFHVLSSPDKVFAICATARLTWLCRRMLREVHEM